MKRTSKTWAFIITSAAIAFVLTAIGDVFTEKSLFELVPMLIAFATGMVITGIGVLTGILDGKR